MSTAALAAAAIGCGPARARSFAVMLSEPSAPRCLPATPADGEGLEGVLEAWVAALLPEDDPAPTEPSGGSARLAPAEEAGLAWFEGFEGPSYSEWNGVVFEGAVHDDHLEVASAGSTRPDAEEAGCDEPLTYEASFVATIDGPRLDGLVRRTEQRALAADGSACAALLVCFRRVAVTGVEEP